MTEVLTIDNRQMVVESCFGADSPRFDALVIGSMVRGTGADVFGFGEFPHDTDPYKRHVVLAVQERRETTSCVIDGVVFGKALVALFTAVGSGYLGQPQEPVGKVVQFTDPVELQEVDYALVG